MWKEQSQAWPSIKGNALFCKLLDHLQEVVEDDH